MNTLFVYWNLTKKIWSLRDVKTGLVIAHKSNFTILNAQFKVSEAGRQRVLAQKRKNVHAGIRGEFSVVPLSGSRRVRYNPYQMATFQLDGEPISFSLWAEFREDGSVWV